MRLHYVNQSRRKRPNVIGHDARQDWPDYLLVDNVPTDWMSPPTALRGRSRNTVFGGWRGLGRVWAIVIAVTGSAVALLQAMGPPPVEREVRPVAATAEGPVPSALPPLQRPNPAQSQSREAAPDAIATKVPQDNPYRCRTSAERLANHSVLRLDAPSVLEQDGIA